MIHPERITAGLSAGGIARQEPLRRRPPDQSAARDVEHSWPRSADLLPRTTHDIAPSVAKGAWGEQSPAPGRTSPSRS